MKRFVLACLGLASLFAAGCCCGQGMGNPYGAGYPAGTPVGSAYAPMYSTQATYVGPTTTAAVPTTYVNGAPVTASLVPMESLPTY